MPPNRIIYPPRPQGKIPPGHLQRYEKRPGWVVQRKFNGTRNLIWVSPDHGEVKFYRPGEEHRQYKLEASMRKQVLELNLPDGECWLDSELLYAKTTTPDYKGRVVLFDILHAGNYLFGKKLANRLDILQKVCGNPQSREPNLGLALQVTNDIWMAETFDCDFRSRFEDFINHPEIEGVVLKRLAATLDNTGAKKYEVPWQIRVRKPHKNYQF